MKAIGTRFDEEFEEASLKTKMAPNNPMNINEPVLRVHGHFQELSINRELGI